jgi:hypothetical protein
MRSSEARNGNGRSFLFFVFIFFLFPQKGGEL